MGMSSALKNLFLLSLLFVGTFGLSKRLATYTVAQVDDSEDSVTVTALTAKAAPDFVYPDAIYIAAGELDVDVQNGKTATANGRAMAFAHSTPDYVGSDSVNYYFAVAEATAVYDGNTATTNIAASYAEIVAAFAGIFAYIDNDGESGFQWTGEHDFFTGDGGDQIVFYKSFNDDYFWNPLSFSSSDCSTDPNAIGNCTVYSITATTNEATPEIQFDMTVTSQKIDLSADANLVPTVSKIDVTVRFPWAEATTCTGDCRLGILAIAAGKAASGSVEYSSSGGVGYATFQGENDDSALFTWKEDAEITDSAGVTVIVSGVSGDDLLNIDTTGTSIQYTLVIGIWKIWIGIWQGFQWTVNFYFFSVDEAQPALFYWDPEVGSGSLFGISALLALVL